MTRRSLLCLLRGKIARRKGNLSNDTQHYVEAVQQLTEAKTLREADADANNKRDKFGYVCDDQELYTVIVKDICEIAAGLHVLGAQVNKLHVASAKMMYGFCAVKFGIEDLCTCVALTV